MSIDRVENWKKFSRHMEEYIGTWTVEKYQVEDSGGCDLMSITKDIRICIWNILRYATRLWNGHAKDQDIEKIVHYCELAWTLSEGNILKNDNSEE